MASQYGEYVMKRTELSDAELNKRWKSIDLRLVGMEATAFTFAENQEELTALALTRINEALTPIIIEAQNFAHLGDLLRARSFTTQSISLGTQTFFIQEADRNIYAAPLYVIIASTADSAKWMAGNTISYDPVTGALVVNVTNTRDVGSYSDWTVTIAGIPPDIPPAADAQDIALTGVPGLAAANVKDGFIEVLADLEAGILAGAGHAPLASPAFTGNPTAVTQSAGNNSTRLATTGFVQQAFDAFVGAAPGALNTLLELAAALGNDANYAATITGQMATINGTLTSLQTQIDTYKVVALTWQIDGGAAVITTGLKYGFYLPFAVTLTEWTLGADVSGSINIDVWADTQASFPPVAADKISTSAMVISSAFMAQDNTITDWTEAIPAGRWIFFNVNSVTNIKFVSITLKGVRA